MGSHVLWCPCKGQKVTFGSCFFFPTRDSWGLNYQVLWQTHLGTEISHDTVRDILLLGQDKLEALK